MTPRKLQVLRIEDDVRAQLDQSLPLIDLGLIDRWHSFVEDLRAGRLTVYRSTERKMLWTEPDILTVDFRFGLDDSTAEFTRVATPGQMAWSHKLNDKNTGILIGATLQALLGGRDAPTVAFPHSGVPGDVGWDWSTVLLFGQMMALSGLYEAEGEYDVQAQSILNGVPSDAGSAIRGNIGAYRSVLARRLEGSSRDEGPRLSIDPDQLIVVISNLDAAEDDADLDARLSREGLGFWNRDGVYDALDLRSVFLDRLVPLSESKYQFERPAGETWGFVKLSDAVVRVENDVVVVGELKQFCESLQRTAETHYSLAGGLVSWNSDPMVSPRRFADRDPAGAKFLGVVFAAAEAGFRMGKEVRRRLGEGWDPLADASKVEAPRTLGQILDALWGVLADMKDLVKPTRWSSDGFYPPGERALAYEGGVHRCPGVFQGIGERLQNEPTTNRSETLRRALRYGEDSESGQRVQAVARLLEYLTALGRADRRFCPVPAPTSYRIRATTTRAAGFRPGKLPQEFKQPWDAERGCTVPGEDKPTLQGLVEAVVGAIATMIEAGSKAGVLRFTRVQSSSTDEPSIVGALRRYVEDAGRPFTEVLKREILRNRCEDEVVAKAIEQVLDRAAEVKLVERQVAPTQAVYRAVPRACQLGMAATVSRRDLARLLGYAVPQMIDFRVTGAAEGKYTIRVNGTRFEVAAAGGNVKDVRDQLVIAINAGKEPVTALQRGDDTVRVTGNIAHKAFSFASASTGDALLETRVEADVTNEIKRPITGAGYTDYSAFVDRLVKGAVPSHLAYAAGWYMHKYHGDDVRLAWPSWCKWNK